MQFRGPLTDDAKKELSALGVEMFDTLSGNALLCRMSEPARDKIAARDDVLWVTPFLPVYRISQRLLDRLAGSDRRPPAGKPILQAPKEAAVSDTLTLTVSAFTREQLAAVRQFAKANGGQVLAESDPKRRPQVRLTLPASAVVLLARVPGVRRIDLERLPGLHQADVTVESENPAFQLRWHDHLFFSNRPLPFVDERLRAEERADGSNIYFVQFRGAVTSQQKSRLAEAGAILAYVPNNTYLVEMTAEARRSVQQLRDVQWIGLFQPAHKLSNRLLRRVDGEVSAKPAGPFIKPAPQTSEPELYQLKVIVVASADLQSVIEDVQQQQGKVLESRQGKRESKLRVTVPADRVLALAHIDEILWIEEEHLPRLHPAGR